MNEKLLSNFKGNEISDELKKLYDYKSPTNDLAIDFEKNFDGQESLNSFFENEARDKFIVIGQHPSHSLIAYWILPKHDISNAPIVWLDSEGSPMCVFCSSIQEFLSLLPYNTGMIYDIICAWQRYLKNPSKITPSARFDQSVLDENLQELESSFPSYKNFTDYITNVIGVSRAVDPVKIIGDSIQKFPSLEDYIKESEGW